MKSVSLIIILLIGFAISANCQRKQKVDVVYLNSGVVLKGHITDSIPEVSVTFQTLDKEFHFIPREDITWITTEFLRKSNQTIDIENDDYYEKQENSKKSEIRLNKEPPSYWLWLNLGGGFSISQSGEGIRKVNFVNGLKFENNFALGIGIGLRASSQNGAFAAPIYIQIQPPLTKGAFGPMFGIAAGVTTYQDLNWKVGGGMIRADVGLQAKIGPSDFLTFTVGYEALGISPDNTGTVGAESNLTFESISFNIGYKF